MTLAILLEGLDRVEPLQAGPLRTLAKRAVDVTDLLEVAGDTALDAVPEMAEALADLEEHLDTLLRLHEMDDLADDVERLGRALRALRHHRDELERAVQEEDEST